MGISSSLACEHSPAVAEEPKRITTAALGPSGLLPSLYRRRVAQLAAAAFEAPPAAPLETTLRQCVAFCYGGGPDWAPHVRVTVYADNPSEHQSNVPVYETLLVTWGEPGFEGRDVRCTAIQGTDVKYGRVMPSPFWSRSVKAVGTKKVPCRALMHKLLDWFLGLEDQDKRKQLLVNMLLQLHEACYNCIGRHKEVFEYCVYDLADAESRGSRSLEESGEGATEDPSEQARHVVRRFAAQHLDWHKRAALHSAILSPLKFIFQKQYEVFENLDSHGASFWCAVLTQVFFQGLEMPFESLGDLDIGWTWGAVDFLPSLQRGSDSQEALKLLSDPENLGADWRRLTARLRPSGPRPYRLAGLDMSFERTISRAAEPDSTLRAALEPYAARFAEYMVVPLILRRCVLRAISAERWDLDLGPAFAQLSAEVLGVSLTAEQVRERLYSGAAGSTSMEGYTQSTNDSLDIEAMRSLLQTAKVDWV